MVLAQIQLHGSLPLYRDCVVQDTVNLGHLTTAHIAGDLFDLYCAPSH